MPPVRSVLPALTLPLLTACGETPGEVDTARGASPAAEESAAAGDTEKEVPMASREHMEAMRAQFARIEMQPDISFLPDTEKEVVAILSGVGDIMSRIYLRQVSNANSGWRDEIAALDHPDRDLLLDLFDLHFGPWDTLDDDEPFYGSARRPAGSGFYPPDMTREEFEAWIDAHPDDAAAFTSPYTVIRRDDTGGLIAIPYSEYYADLLAPAAALMLEAAAITTNDSLRRFLDLRAEALLNDDYFESELAWMDLEGPIEVAIGPYEVYDDKLFGRKTAFEAFITVKNPEESAALDKYKGLLRDMEENLPVPDRYKNFARGFESPIAVVDQVHGGGDNVPGVQTIAFNLPNDERVREAKGAKKVLLNNVMGAKFEKILAPMASRVLVPEQAMLLMREYMGLNTLFHELSHSLGPGTISVEGRKTTVSEELAEHYSAIEEGKADVMGAYNVLYMMERGELPVSEKENFLATYAAGLFRSMRFGTGEAHGKGAAFQYSFYRERGALTTDPETGLIEVDFPALEEAIRELTAKVIILQGEGDHQGAEAFLDSYGVLDADAERLIASMETIPVDIQPVYPALP